MPDARQRLVAEWLAKADEDYEVAKLLIEQERRLLGAGVYHCQQAAEKALKAVLTHRQLVFPKTHDLELLLSIWSEGHEGATYSLRPAARELTPLASAFRYPGDMHQPSENDAKVAMEHASQILHFAKAACSAGV